MQLQYITLITSLLFFICVVVLVAIVKFKKSENFALPFKNIGQALHYRLGKSSCTDGCVLRTRYGSFLDNQCANMCRNWYIPIPLVQKSQSQSYGGYNSIDTTKYDALGKKLYFDSLHNSYLTNGQYNRFSTISQP